MFKDNTMKIRILSAAGLLLALAGCSTTSGSSAVSFMPPPNPVRDYWVGKSAGVFFAAYGPPIGDHDESGDRVYNWRGGYKTLKVPAKYASAQDGKKGKLVAPARSIKVSCKADIVTDSSYTIRDVRILGDMPGATSSSYCAELLVPAQG